MDGLEAPRLNGVFVDLEPLTAAAMPQVRAALDADPQSWALMVSNGGGAAFEDWWRAETASTPGAARRCTYLIRRRADGEVVGVTGFYDIREDGRIAAIGSTFLHPTARGSPANAEAKLLMLEHAFSLGAVRIEFHVDTRNLRSQRALEKLGCIREGTLRKYWVSSAGLICDSCLYAVTDDDWPMVRAAITARVAQKSGL